MLIRIYEQDAYVFEFEGKVTSVDNDWVSLDATAFYPGGGGQVNDLGMICGLKVTDVKMKGDDILHKVPGHGMKKGDDVWCSVDWDRRYDLMKGHTSEHLLFGGLKRSVPEICIVKIFISPESKYVVVDRDVGWDDIRKAQEFVNTAIKDNHSVTKSTMEKDDPDMETVRVKLDRIDDDLVTVVEIGDVDTAACGGIHVRETEEIGAVLVDRKVSAGKDGFAVHFRVGNDALVRSLELANTCVQMSEILGTRTEDSVKALQNLKHDSDARKEQMKAALQRMVNDMRPETIGGIAVYSGIFETDERKIITDAAEKVKNNGGIAVLLIKGDSLSVMMSSGSNRVDCSSVLKEVMGGAGGKGGGKKDFAQGGVQDVTNADNILNDLLRSVKNALE
ncbi:MAG: alanyl-tRNA editing protein [Methanomassiliicoccaceae archaeon]|jgi:alanyl-tRNA synthetase|nr:alanyl-tRNA editing protein [Methanomassiliicoccaceae archaeon]